MDNHDGRVLLVPVETLRIVDVPGQGDVVLLELDIADDNVSGLHAGDGALWCRRRGCGRGSSQQDAHRDNRTAQKEFAAAQPSDLSHGVVPSCFGEAPGARATVT